MTPAEIALPGGSRAHGILFTKNGKSMAHAVNVNGSNVFTLFHSVLHQEVLGCG
jgi:hypothetical protein